MYHRNKNSTNPLLIDVVLFVEFIWLNWKCFWFTPSADLSINIDKTAGNVHEVTICFIMDTSFI